MSNRPSADSSGSTDSVRRRILDAACALMEEQGLSDVTMTGIAERADVSRQTVYNNFANVESAILHYLLEEIDRMVDRMTEMLSSTTDPTQQISIFVREAVGRFAHRDFQVSSQMLMSPEAARQMEERIHRLRDQMVEIVNEGIETGEFTLRVPAERAADIVFHMIGGIGQLMAREADADVVADDVTRMLIHGLAG